MERGIRLKNRQEAVTERNRLEWHRKRKAAPKNKATVRARNRERQQKRRERIRSNPELHAAEKRKERARWVQRRSEGKVKTTSEMSAQELRLVRRKRNIAQKQFQIRRRREALDQEALNEDPDIPEVPHATEETSRKSKGRKRIIAHRTSANRKLQAAREENTKLKRKLWKERKTQQRKKCQQDLTPRSRVQKLVKGRVLGSEVRKRLLFGEVLSSELKEAVRNKGLKVKKVFHRILSGRILKRYKMLKHVKGILSPKLLAQRNADPDLLACTKATKKSRVNTTSRLKDFFERDDISAECPDAKGFVIKFGRNKATKIKKRKRYLMGTMSDLYKKYCETEKKPVSFSLFCKLKPFYVVHKNAKERNTCLCKTCENTNLLVKALNRAKVIKEASNLSLIPSLCCDDRTDDCLQRKCTQCASKQVTFLGCDDAQTVNYQQWEKKDEERFCKKTKKMKTISRVTLVGRVTTIGELKAELLKIQEKYLCHVFRDWHQHATLKKVRTNLKEGEIFVLMDFSQDYVCKFAREIQSHFYGASKETVSLHTGVVYGNQGVLQSFCTVSASSRHDPAAILAHLLPVLTKVLTPGITRLNFQSDSPSSQYRNRYTFYLIVKYLTSVFPQITSLIYNFTEGGHGKSTADGIGGSTKNTLDYAVENGTDVSNIDQVLAVLKENCKKIFVEKIEEETMKKIHAEIPPFVPPFNGSNSAHQYTWTKETPNDVFFNSVSCYDCSPGMLCAHYALPNNPWHPVETADGPPASKPVKKGDWVAVKFGKHWYPGLVEKSNASTLTIDFMVKHTSKEDLFLWPPKPDKQVVPRTGVLHVLTTPPTLATRCHFSIAEKEVIDRLI